MRRVLSIFAMLLLLGFMSVQAETPVDLSGKYLCAGTQGGDKYSLSLRIAAFDETYLLQWENSSGDPILQGLAVFDHGDLAVALQAANGAIGSALYRSSPGVLDGKWTRGDGKVDTEVCRKGDKIA